MTIDGLPSEYTKVYNESSRRVVRISMRRYVAYLKTNKITEPLQVARELNRNHQIVLIDLIDTETNKLEQERQAYLKAKKNNASAKLIRKVKQLEEDMRLDREWNLTEQQISTEINLLNEDKSLLDSLFLDNCRLQIEEITSSN